MTKPTFGTHPFLLGFDELERLVEHTVRTGNEGYPPYNIEQTGAAGFRITLAVAGFAEDDLSITLEDRQLVIRGRSRDNSQGDERIYLHRGIAARQFQRAFVLADGVDVSGAHLEHGLLHVSLQRTAPENVVKTIQIDSGRSQVTEQSQNRPSASPRHEHGERITS